MVRLTAPACAPRFGESWRVWRRDTGVPATQLHAIEADHTSAKVARCARTDAYPPHTHRAHTPSAPRSYPHHILPESLSATLPYSTYSMTAERAEANKFADTR